MDITKVAAFGGLILGLVNLGIILYKEFFKSGELEVIDDDFYMKLPDNYPQEYDIQINLRFRAKFETIHIKRVFLINENEFTNHHHSNIRQVEFLRSIPYKSIDLKGIKFSEYKKLTDEIFKDKSNNLTDMKLDKGGLKSLSFTARLSGVREPDSWELIPTKGWSLKIEYDKKEIVKSLNATIIK